MELLLNYQTDINAMDIKGTTPLHIAIDRCQFTCIWVLLQPGMRVDFSSNHVILGAVLLLYIVIIHVVVLLLPFLLIVALPLFSACFSLLCWCVCYLICYLSY